MRAKVSRNLDQLIEMRMRPQAKMRIPLWFRIKEWIHYLLYYWPNKIPNQVNVDRRKRNIQKDLWKNLSHVERGIFTEFCKNKGKRS
jgi:hypothetical protein